jgi:uncharacterized protein with PIN domain
VPPLALGYNLGKFRPVIQAVNMPRRGTIKHEKGTATISVHLRPATLRSGAGICVPFSKQLLPMKQVWFRFYAELNDFLPAARRQIPFCHAFEGRVSIKHLIEALGVPHPEVDLVLANGRSVDFSYLVQDGDRISVYPVFESLDITPLVHLRPQPLRETRFVLDTHLGRLAAYLRMLGFDTVYRNDTADEELARISSQEGRILLTRDRGLLKRGVVTHGYCMRETAPRRQLLEVLRRFDLFQAVTPFSRCLRCNGTLQPVAKEAISHRLPSRTRLYYDEFSICGECNQIYWKGSHYQRMRQFIERVLAQRETDDGDG